MPPPAPNEPQAGDPPAPRRRRLLRRVGLGLALAVALLALGLVAVRLYLSDARLRSMAVSVLSERLGTNVSLERLELKLASGLDLHGLRVGPPPGFTQDVATIGRAALHWDAWALFGLRVRVPELALEEAVFTLEENERGQNVGALLANLAPPEPAPAAEGEQRAPAAAEARPAPLEQPDIPVAVELERLLVRDVTLRVRRPDMNLELTRAGLSGRLHAKGRALDLELWAGLGSRDSNGEASVLRVERTEPPLDVQVTQHLGLTMTSWGFGDVQLAFDLDARTEIKAPKALPALTLRARNRARLDLLSGRAALSECEWRVGERSVFSTRLTASEILAAPAVAIEALGLSSDLAELMPYVQAVAPGTKLAGVVSVEAQPLDVPAAVAQRLDQLETAWTMRAVGVNAEANGNRVDDLNAEATVRLAAGKVSLDADATVVGAGAPGASARRIGANLQVRTPLMPWVGGAPDGAVDAALSVSVADAKSGANRAAGITMRSAVSAPIALVRAAPDAPPLTAHLELAVAEAEAPGARARGVTTAIDVTTWDLAGIRAQVAARAGVAEAISGEGPEALGLTDLGAELKVMRRGDDYDIEKLRLTAAGLVELRGVIQVAGATSAAPHLRKMELSLEPFAVERALALLPPARRPPAKLTGAFSAKASMSGVIPHHELAALAAAPVLQAESPTAFADAIEAYARYLERWAQRLERRLPFSGQMSMRLQDAAFVDAANELAGLDFETVLELTPGGPRWRTTTEIKELTRPVSANALSSELELSFLGRKMRMAARGTIGTLSHAGLTRPLERAAAEFSSTYEVGGDLTLEKLALAAPDRNLDFTASGLVSRPLAVAASRAWERAGLPGVMMALRWQGSFMNETAEMLTPSGPGLEGGMGTQGELRIDDGVMTLAGKLEMKKLSLRAGTLAVDTMSGELPFDLRIAFGRRADATPIARGLGFAGGELGLITSAEDIRERPQKPPYYESLRRYRRTKGLEAKSIISGPYIVEDFELDGRLENGILVADWLRMHVLGGDLVGSAAFQLGRDRSLRGDMSMRVSNVDASYFEALGLTPGPESEMNADMRFGFLFAPKRRDLTMNMNVTKIGADTLDRFLQLLDPEAKDETIQKNRGYLGWVTINNVAMWIRYENFNMDMTVDFPWKLVLDRELVRRYNVTDSLDIYVQPAVDKLIAPALGWNDAN